MKHRTFGKTFGRQALSVLLALVLLVGLLPLSAAAAVDVDAAEWNITGTETLATTRVVKSGETLTVTGSGTLTAANGTPLFIVMSGGHLTLDGVTVSGSTVDGRGAVYVQSGATLDLGHNDRLRRTAPKITANTTAAGAACNLVIEAGATVRLNAETSGPIGVSFAQDITHSAPQSLIQGGRYTVQDTDLAAARLNPDVSTSQLHLENDKVVLANKTPKVLYWYPTDSFRWSRSGDTSLADARQLQPLNHKDGSDLFKSTGADTACVLGSQTNRVSFLDDGTVNGNLKQFDLIYITSGVASGSQTVGPYTEEEAAALLDYLDAGGRIIIQAEDAYFGSLNASAQSLAQRLNAPFSLSTAYNGVLSAKSNQDSPLTSGVGADWSVLYCTKIEYSNPKSEVVFTCQEEPFCVDLAAGSSSDGIPWGNVMLISDGNFWHFSDYTSGMTKPNTTQFAQNLITNTLAHRITAATGVNPNDTVDDPQAQIGTTAYRTPADALDKVLDGETVTLLKSAGLTPARDMLLFNNATVAQAAGGTVTAAADGTTLDIAADGSVTLKSGVANVSDTAKVSVDGYTVASSAPYTVTVRDDDSPFTVAQGGMAGFTATADQQTFTLTKNGKSYNYTADRAGDKIYPGVFDVTYTNTHTQQVGDQPENPWYNQPYSFTLKPDVGYALHAANISLTMGETELKPGVGFTAVEDKDTGNLTVTVPRVTGNLAITATPDKDWPTVTVVGMARETAEGDYTRRLYSVPTVQELSETRTEADFTAWDIDSYKPTGVKIKNDDSETTGTLKDIAGGLKGVTLDLTKGDTTVTFLYDRNMADVKINAYYTGTTDPVEDFPTDLKISAEIGKEFTYAQPTLAGYNSDGSAQEKATVTVTGKDDHLDFYYTRKTGNVTYRAVDADGKELASKTVTVDKDAVIDSSADKAAELFTVPYYQLSTTASAAVDGAKDGKYDGQHNVTVTYTYGRIQKTVTVNMVNVATNETVATKEFAGLDTGREHTLDLTDKIPTNYQAVGSTSLKYFVKDEDGQALTLYLRRTDKAEVTVSMVLQGQTAPFQTYTLTGEYGVEMTVTPPTVTGYTYVGPETVTVTPTEDGDSAIVTLEYVLDSKTVTVKLLDTAGKEIAQALTFTVKRGDGLSVYAPAVSGYQLAADQSATQALTAKDIFDSGKTELTFRYVAVTGAQVALTVIDKYGRYELGRRTVLVPQGEDCQVDVRDYAGYKIASATYNGTEQTLTAGPLTAAFRDHSEVVFTYVRADNSAVVPAGDGKIGTADDVVIRPVEGGEPLVPDADTGKVELPRGGSVEFPGAPNGSGSTVTVPAGTVVDASGTVHLPEDKAARLEPAGTVLPGGSTVDPDGTPNYKYTVRYVDSQGAERLTSGSVLVKAGAEHTFTAPALNGYTVDAEQQTLVGGTEPFTVTFTYTKTAAVTPAQPADDEPVVEPAQPQQPQQADSAPKTGDSSRLPLWLALSLVSCGAIITAAVGNSKKRSKKSK